MRTFKTVKAETVDRLPKAEIYSEGAGESQKN